MKGVEDVIFGSGPEAEDRLAALHRLDRTLSVLDEGLRAFGKRARDDIPPATPIKPDADDDLFATGEP